MSRIRVLVVDDSVVVRKLISEALATDPALEVVGVAANGSIALKKIPAAEPDVVVLDVEMPVMDGLATLRELKRLEPAPRVIMFSALTTAGAKVSVDALTLGAEECVAKPGDVTDPIRGVAAIRAELVSKIKLLCRAPPARARPAPAPALAASWDVRPRSTGRAGPVDVIAIGASTGGPNVLADLFLGFPRSLRVPVVLVQHMPAHFTPHLAERLNRESVFKVEEASDGAPVLPGCAYVAPGGRHLRVERQAAGAVCRLDDSPPVHSVRPAADVLFESVARHYQARALAVVLTGMGEDGLDGARRMVEAGARVLVQDEASSVVWGMAGAVARAGLADAALPVPELADEIVRRAI